MNKSAVVFHLLFWIIAYFVWLSATVANHPNWTLRILCTFVLVSCSALFACKLSPRCLSFSDIFMSLALLLLSGLAAAIIIHFLYDWSVGADPRRFSLASNIVMDIAVVLFNTVVAFVVSQIIKNIFGLPVWFLSESK